MSYFPEPYTRSKNNKKVELDLSNYATKSDSKRPTGVDTSKFAKKADLPNLKSEIDKLDIDESKTIPADLSKQRDVVKNCGKVVKKKKL